MAETIYFHTLPFRFEFRDFKFTIALRAHAYRILPSTISLEPIYATPNCEVHKIFSVDMKAFFIHAYS